MKYLGSDWWFIYLVALLFVGFLIIGGIQLHDAIDCSNKGGLYLTGKGIWPVCLNVETIK